MKKYIIFYLVLLFPLYSCSDKKEDAPKVEIKPKVMSEDVAFNTSDNKKINGTFFYSNTEVQKKSPLVVLVHQFMSDRKQWNRDFIDSLVNKKYKVITYDIRNHGESDKVVDDITDILRGKGNAKADLIAVFDWAKKRPDFDSTRFAVVGTSIGGALALYSKYELGSKTAVCISVGKSTFEDITGMDMRMGPTIRKTNSVLFICGDKDDKYPEDAKYIYNTYIDEPRDLRYFNSDKHGKDLINQNPEINKIILDWLGKYL